MLELGRIYSLSYVRPTLGKCAARSSGRSIGAVFEDEEGGNKDIHEWWAGDSDAFALPATEFLELRKVGEFP